MQNLGVLHDRVGRGRCPSVMLRAELHGVEAQLHVPSQTKSWSNEEALCNNGGQSNRDVLHTHRDLVSLILACRQKPPSV